MGQKKMLMKQLDQKMMFQNNVNMMAFQQENIQDHIQMANIMGQVVTAQEQQMKNMDFDKMYDLRDKMEELNYEAQDIQEMMQESFGMDQDFDSDELDEEIAEMEAEGLNEQVFNVGPQQNYDLSNAGMGMNQNPNMQ